MAGKICPHMSKTINENGKAQLHKVYCLEHECAWWKSEQKGCAVLAVIDELSTISGSMNPKFI